MPRYEALKYAHLEAWPLVCTSDLHFAIRTARAFNFENGNALLKVGGSARCYGRATGATWAEGNLSTRAIETLKSNFAVHLQGGGFHSALSVNVETPIIFIRQPCP